MNILYRIYEIKNRKVTKEEYVIDNKEELLMDIMVCESRDHFKSIIKSVWGDDIHFRYSKTLPVGSKYCIIIGECYNPEKYLQRQTYKCDYCGATITAFSNPLRLSEWEIKVNLFNDEESREKKFCSHQCMYRYEEKRKAEISPDDEKEFWVNRDSFSEIVSGYIYLITKKSTSEFYVGKTVYAPPFRWVQHLKGSRFNIADVTDFKFEVIEIVPSDKSLSERELFWIQKKYDENPKCSLNIAGIKKKGD